MQRDATAWDHSEYGPLAQLVEQLTLNQRVRSSTLRRPIGNTDARVAELADALDLGSSPLNGGWGFKSPLSQWIPLSYCTEGISFASASSPLFPVTFLCLL